MGYYINALPDGTKLPSSGKVPKILTFIPGSKQIAQPKEWIEDLVCVVDNGPFDAAGYCYDWDEFKVFTSPDERRKVWLIVPGAAKLSGYQD